MPRLGWRMASQCTVWVTNKLDRGMTLALQGVMNGRLRCTIAISLRSEDVSTQAQGRAA